MKKAIITFIGLLMIATNAMAESYKGSVDVIEPQQAIEVSEASFVLNGDEVVSSQPAVFTMKGSTEYGYSVNAVAGESSEGVSVTNIAVSQDGETVSVGSDLNVEPVSGGTQTEDQFVTYNVDVIFE